MFERKDGDYEDRHHQGPEDGENRHLQILRERPPAADGQSAGSGRTERRDPLKAQKEDRGRKEEDKLKG